MSSEIRYDIQYDIFAKFLTNWEHMVCSCLRTKRETDRTIKPTLLFEVLDFYGEP